MLSQAGRVLGFQRAIALVHTMVPVVQHPSGLTTPLSSSQCVTTPACLARQRVHSQLACRRSRAPKRSSRGARHLTHASSAGGEPEAGLLTVDEACKLLGVNSDATFDDILQAKEKLLRYNDGNTEKMMQVGMRAVTNVSRTCMSTQIEAAYDLLLMDSMKRRLSGEVASSVRFADVQRKRTAPAQVCGGFCATW